LIEKKMPQERIVHNFAPFISGSIPKQHVYYFPHPDLEIHPFTDLTSPWDSNSKLSSFRRISQDFRNANDS